MIITFTNVIGAIRNAISSVITTNLKMWLGFETSETLGREEVVNGDFATDSDWNKNSNWSISSGVAIADGTTNGDINQGTTLATIGNSYSITYEVVSISQGSFFFKFGGVSGAFRDEIGIYTEVIQAINTNRIALDSLNNAIGSVTNISVREVTQITPDKSGNNNVGELFTGKALEFDGGGDYVDIDFTTQIKSAVFWVKPLDTGVQSILGFGGAYSGSKYIKSVNNNIQSAGLSSVSVYVNGVSTTSVPVNQWSRVVVNFALLTPQELKFGYGFDTYGYIQLSDVQLYNENLSTDDIAYDYANPNKLAIDNPSTSLSVTNLKGYWALSEGDGFVAYDSSGEYNNGTINGADYVDAQPRIPQLGMMNWSKGSNSLTFSEDFSNSVWTKGTGTSVTGGFTDPLGGNTAYKASYDGVGSQPYIFDDLNNTTNIRSIWARTVSGTGQIHLTSHSSNSNSLFNLTTEWQRVSAIPTSGAGIANYYLVDFRGSSDLTEVLVWGAQIDDSTTLGGYRPTSGTTVPSTILIPNPTIPTQDIFGNAVRDRLNSLNLDGSGYAEVADDTDLDIGTGAFTMECWVKADFENTGSSQNIIFILGGEDANTDTASITTNSTKFLARIGSRNLVADNNYTIGDWYHICVTRDDSASGLCTMYIDAEAQADTETTSASITNTSTKLIGRDSLTNRFYKNLISDVRLYKGKALSADEVENNYNAGLSAHTN